MENINLPNRPVYSHEKLIPNDYVLLIYPQINTFLCVSRYEYNLAKYRDINDYGTCAFYSDELVIENSTIYHLKMAKNSFRAPFQKVNVVFKNCLFSKGGTILRGSRIFNVIEHNTLEI